MSDRDRGEVKYVSPTNVRHEYVPPAAPAAETTLACTEAVGEAERVAVAAEHPPTERFATVKLVYTGPGSTDGGLPPEPAPKQRRAKAKPAKRKRKPLIARATLRPTAPRKPRRPRTQAAIDLTRHKRRCGVCHDPAREAIEEAFLQWRNVDCIDSEFEPEGGRSAIYRHAHALDLFRKRSLNLRSALEYIIEESERVTPTAEGIVRAMRAYTRINDVGEWTDPPTKHIVQVIAMPSTNTANLDNPIQGLALDVRKDRSQIIYPDAGRVESGVRQPLLTETAQQTEIGVTA
ncbi:MAG TPA: hypothetical protein VN881_11135 [Candidatus Acidoferrales bacterium]|nr:hypothetical protein [Candidatus Acidoferrales bacterium]